MSDSQSGLSLARLGDLGVPAPGEWQLRLWRQDAAGNHEPANASLPVSLRYDPEPPQLGFEAPPAADPTLISVAVTERISGLADGQIEMSQEGSGSWQVLPTQRDGDRLMARIDDASFSPGTYLLRATARDQAGNLNSTDRRLDGQPMVMSLPLRVATSLNAGFLTSRTVKKNDSAPGEAPRDAPSNRGDEVPRASRVRTSDTGPRGSSELGGPADRKRRGGGVLAQRDHSGTARRRSHNGCQRSVLVHRSGRFDAHLAFRLPRDALVPANRARGHPARPSCFYRFEPSRGDSSTARLSASPAMSGRCLRRCPASSSSCKSSCRGAGRPSARRSPDRMGRGE